jgi:hypothetical protein
MTETSPSMESQDLFLVFNETSKKLLNLARQWSIQYLPHCISKINRVGYGILQENDIKLLISLASGEENLKMTPARQFLGI